MNAFVAEFFMLDCTYETCRRYVPPLGQARHPWLVLRTCTVTFLANRLVKVPSIHDVPVEGSGHSLRVVEKAFFSWLAGVPVFEAGVSWMSPSCRGLVPEVVRVVISQR